MNEFQEFKKELLKNPEFRKEYQRLAPRYRVISEVIGARIRKKMTQKDLAEKIGTKQSAIARLESGNLNPSLEFLEKIAAAMGGKLRIRIVQ
ncbi:MAG: transcriptional regulator [Candidatus Pacebacteria bacterium CG_4_10_14_0_8_um_filter_43_12]|nr:MAG: transcriptional regulator [Candidatus Pacebacteria bacterium CG10_big_fil_rev_8_21_14_0_10_44_11]PIY79086.1 MAG: transcriptional regulator [Candidatus Pacebacteria bacterium CG_4_10_14_0_8_um_filter_43_12]